MSVTDNLDKKIAQEVIHRSEGDLFTQESVDSLRGILNQKTEDVVKQFIELKASNSADSAEFAMGISNLQAALLSEVANLKRDIVAETTARIKNYDAMEVDIKKYLTILSDITLDSTQITLDDGELEFGAWTIISQARQWDLEIIDMINNMKSGLSVSLDNLNKKTELDSNYSQAVIEAALDQLSNLKIIKDTDKLLHQTADEMSKLAKELENEAINRSKEIESSAQAINVELTNQANKILDKLKTETNDRIQEITKEALTRQAQIDDLSTDLSNEVQTLIDNLKDGVTKDIEQVREGNQTTLNSLNAYKVSNDSAVSAVAEKVSVIVNDNKATAEKLNTVTAQSKQNKDDIAQVNTKVSTLVTSTEANANDIKTVKSQLDTKASAVTVENINSKVIKQGNDLSALTDKVTTLKTSVDDKVSNSTFNQLKSSSEQIGNKVTIQGGQITNIQNSVNNLGNTKADNSAVESLSSKLNKTNEDVKASSDKITSLTNTVNSQGNLINTKASNTAVDALKGEVTKTQNNIDAVSNKYTDLNNQVNAIGVGGRNLIIKNNLLVGWFDAKTGEPTGKSNAYDPNYYEVKPNQNFVFTYITNNGFGTGGTGLVCWYDKDKNYIGSVPSHTINNFISRYFTAPSNAAYYRYALIHANITAMFERGNIPTDYTPAPEDMATSSAVSALESRVSTSEKGIEVNNNDITKLKSNLDTVQGLVNTKASAEALNNTVANVNRIDGVVKITTGNLTTLQNSFNNMSVGGRNLLNYSDFSKAWVFGKDDADASAYLVDDGVVEINGITDGKWKQWQCDSRGMTTLNEVVDGQEYTISVDVRYTDDGVSVGMQHQVWVALRDQTSGSSPNTDTVRIVRGSVTNLSNQWKRITGTGIASIHADHIYWRFIIGYNGKGKMQFRRPKLEQGNIATPWEPALEDNVEKINANNTATQNLTNELVKTNESIKQQNISITNLGSSLQKNIDSKADNSAVNTLSTTLNSTNDKLTNMVASISDLRATTGGMVLSTEIDFDQKNKWSMVLLNKTPPAISSNIVPDYSYLTTYNVDKVDYVGEFDTNKGYKNKIMYCRCRIYASTARTINLGNIAHNDSMALYLNYVPVFINQGYKADKECKFDIPAGSHLIDIIVNTAVGYSGAGFLVGTTLGFQVDTMYGVQLPTVINNNLSSALSNLSAKVDVTNGNITNQSTQLTSRRNTLDNLSIGSVNYILGSDYIYDLGTAYENVNQVSSKTFALSSAINFNEFTTFTISCEVYLENAVTVNKTKAYSRIGLELSIALSNGTTLWANVFVTPSTEARNANGRINKTFVLPDAVFITKINYAVFRVRNLKADKVYVRKPQLEYGNVATSWKPALEDGSSMNEATSNAINALESKVTNIDGKVSSTATNLTNLQTTVGKNTSTINETTKSVNGVRASKSISIDNNGMMCGIALLSETIKGVVQSSFGVDVDYFYIGKAAEKRKLAIFNTKSTVINGVTYPRGVWLDTAIIANATIGTAHIADASITNAKIGSLDASKITTGTLSADRIDVNALKAKLVTIGDGKYLWKNTFLDPNGEGTFGEAPITSDAPPYGNKRRLRNRDNIATPMLRTPAQWGDSFSFEAVVRIQKGSSAIRLGVICLDSAGNICGNHIYFPNVSWKEWVRLPNGQHTGWSKCKSVFSINNPTNNPAEISYVVPFIQIDMNHGSTECEWEVCYFDYYKGVTGELIVNGSITADKLKVTELSAITGNLGSITVDSANIRDLSVDTIKIKDNAVNSFYSTNVSCGNRKETVYKSSAEYTFDLWGLDSISTDKSVVVFFNANVQVYQDKIKDWFEPSDNSEANVYINNTWVGKYKSIESYTVYNSGDADDNRRNYQNSMLSLDSTRMAYVKLSSNNQSNALKISFSNIVSASVRLNDITVTINEVKK